MSIKKVVSSFLLILGLQIVFISPVIANLPDFAPPKMQMVDEFGVNMMNGQVTHTLDTVSIGGAMGLSHSISSYTNNFSMSGYLGYADKYYCKGRTLEIKRAIGDILSVVRVTDMDGSTDFIAKVNGQRISIYDAVPYGAYTYEALGDTRHSLEHKSDGYVHWTKPDGTVSIFAGAGVGGNAFPGAVGFHRQTEYPNGFTIYNGWLSGSIQTNTGFALKYINQFDEEDRYLNKQDIPSTQIPPVNPEAWAKFNPKYIQAINLARENCLYPNCTMNWPKAEFDWPAGMPRSIFIGTSQFKVKDAVGAETIFYFRSVDLAFDEYGNYIQGEQVGQRYSPRLEGIKSGNSKPGTMDFEYTYKTKTDMRSAEGVTWVSYIHVPGVINTAKSRDRLSGYSIESQYHSTVQNTGSGVISQVIPSEDRPGTIGYARSDMADLFYESNWRNFITTVRRPSGVKEEYVYSSAGRGNLTQVIKDGITVTAEYPASCDASNRKFCNKPLWTQDGKGNKTHFSYHAPSGQIERVTYPANQQNLVPVTRYEYTQKQAYIQGVYGAPIWLKTAERICAKTNTLGNGCAGGAADELITSYEYNHDNLLMTGMTVTAANDQGAVITKRTCYQYDIYGNKIGEIQPQAQLSSCNP
jgi:hypothetical protein